MLDGISRMSNRGVSYRLFGALLLVVTPRAAFAEPPSDATAGQKLAQQYCAECHVIAPSSKRGWTDAPAFDAIANRQGTTASTLVMYIELPHMHMVNTARPAPEATKIAAYILTLRKR
jgi:cytochrome c